MLNMLSAKTSAMTFFILLSLALVIIIAIGIVAVVSISLRRAAKRYTPAPPIPDGAMANATNTASNAQALPQEDLPDDPHNKPSFWQRWYRRIFKRLGLYDSGQMSLAFSKAIATLRSYVSVKDFKYQIPWYMVLGASNSGKSSIIGNMGLELPIGKVDFGEKPPCDWWFYDQGVLLDVRGDLFLGQDGLSSNDNAWDKLLALLIKNRTSKPIDGIVLTVSASDLQKPKEELARFASSVYRKLTYMQRRLSIKVPIYIVVSKMDAVQGFSRFASRMPADKLGNIFGWSVPYPPERPYKKQWKNEMCSSLDNMIENLQAQVYATSKDASYNDGTIVLFKREMEQFYENLGSYLDTIFKDSHYYETYFLRGVYFSGLAGEGDETNPVPVFTKDIFLQKIFSEHNLAQPILQLLKSNSRNLNFAKIFVLAFSVIWGVGILYNNKEMERYRVDMEPFIYHVERSLQALQKYKGYDYNNKEFQEFLSSSTDSLINKMAKINDSSAYTTFLPASWFSNIDYYVGKAITFSYNDIILQGIHINLLKKVDEIVNMKYNQSTTTSLITNEFITYNIQAYRKLYDYVERLVELERFVKRYNDMEDNHAIDDITVLLKYMYNIDLPKSFFAAAKLYQGVLKRLQDKNINIYHHRDNATDKLIKRYKQYLNTVFFAKNSVAHLYKLQMQFKKLSNQDSKTVTKKDLKELLQNSRNVTSNLEARSMLWLQSPEFKPDDSFSSFITNIAGSKLLGLDVANDIMSITAKAFAEFKNKIIKLSTPITSNLFEIDEKSKKIIPSNQLITATNTIEDFLGEDFFSHVPKSLEPIKSIPAGKILVWDISQLKTATKFMNYYSEYINESLANIPIHLRRPFESVARDALRKIVLSNIAKAQKFQDDPSQYKGFAKNELLINQVNNIKEALAEINRIYLLLDAQIRNEQFLKLKTLIITQCESVLKQVESQLTGTNLYRFRVESVNNWDGSRPLSLHIFDSQDKQDLISYLNNQRGGILQLAQIASPIVTYLSRQEIKQFVDTNLVTKWADIITQLEMYRSNKHENSLKILELFIVNRLNQITPQVCPRNIIRQGGDFFARKHINMVNKISQRCMALMSKGLKAKYEKLTNFFNQRVSGKYPFVGKNVDEYSTEQSSSQDIETLYKMRSQITKEEVERLKQEARTSPVKAEVYNFIKTLDNISHVVQSADKGSGVPGVAATKVRQRFFDITFRPYKDQEIGSEAIVEQVFITANSEINWRSHKQFGRIFPEESVRIMIRWASGSGIYPRYDKKQPHMQISGNTAVFNFEEYGFATMFKKHKWTIEPDNSILLRFEVPITNTIRTDPAIDARVQRSVFLIKIKVYEKDESGGFIGPMPISNHFPVVAPSFGELVDRGIN